MVLTEYGMPEKSDGSKYAVNKLISHDIIKVNNELQEEKWRFFKNDRKEAFQGYQLERHS